MVLNIRDATLEDCPTALEIARAFHQESNFRNVPFSEKKMLSLFEWAISSPAYMFVVFEDDGEIIGGFMAYLDHFYFSDAILATDLALFVIPEKRGRVPIRKVLQMYRSWALTHGAMRINIGSSTGISTERVEKLFALLGFERTGVIFAHFPPNAGPANEGAA